MPSSSVDMLDSEASGVGNDAEDLRERVLDLLKTLH
jgi:hypothetical protein